MEKKYYDIIVSLIKKNDKFLGCEPILEEIVQDVFDHSKVVLGSVTNEDVITAYLNKVVATSLITVPKKLNFNTRNKHRVISSVEAITKVSLQPKPIVEEIKSEPIPETVIPEPEPIQIEEEPIIEENIQFEFEQNNEDLEVIEPELSFETVSKPVEEPIAEETADFEIEQKDDTEEELAIDSDFEYETIEEEEEVGIVEESNNDNTFEAIEEETFVLETEELPLVEEMQVAAEEEETVIESPETTVESLDFDTVEEIIEPDVDMTLVDNMINGVSVATETNEYELIEEPSETEEEEEIEEVIETPSLLEEDSFSLDLAEDNELLEEDTEETVLIEPEDEPALNEVDEVEEEVVESYNIPDFSCFDFEPEHPEFDAEEICADLQELDSKYPEKKVLQICKLKYEEKRSVSEIAELLEVSEETVLDVLNDIIELVKD